MKDRRRPPHLIAIWMVLTVLVAVIVGREIFDAPETAPAPTTTLSLLAFGERDLGSVEVLNIDRRAALTRDATGTWFLHDATHSHAAGEQAASGEAHTSDPATAVELGAAATVAANLNAKDTLEPSRPLAEYGLANPKIIIAYYGRDGVEVDYRRPLATLYVGTQSPDRDTYFASIDDRPGIVLIVREDVDRLLDLMFATAEQKLN